MKNLNQCALLLLFVIVISGCSEPYALQTQDFEDALVVEATVTNEFQKQQVKLSRTYRLEQTAPETESGAIVFITDSDGIQYDFEEDSGRYISESAFMALPGKVYRLNITTTDGKTYSSSSETLTAVNEIGTVVPEVKIKDGIRGVEINVNSYDPAKLSKYYRYEYEESYKIIAPFWNPSRAIVSGEPGNYSIDVIPRSGETRTCYSTEKSLNILLATTTGLTEDRVHFPIRFISNKNPIITHRYSILVTQYVQNLAAYTFYKTLNTISGTGSILSATQPGFFYGNMSCTDNPNEKVLGFFEVASVSSKRIFFNYTDLFPGEGAPPYFTGCEIKPFGFCFDYNLPECDGYNLISAIQTNSLIYYSGMNDTYNMVIPPCGDCTTFSSNIKPSFWID